MPQTATNPKTGEKFELRDGKWVPMHKSATQPSPSLGENLKPRMEDLISGGPGGASLSTLGRLAGAGVQKLEEGSLSSEAKGQPVRAGLKRMAADPLRMVESAGRIGSGMVSAPPPSTMVKGVGLSAALDVVQGRKKGEDQPSRVERGLLGASTIAGMAAMGAEGGAGKGTAKYANVAAELESFRRMVEKKPTKALMDVANTKHAELSAALDKVWEPLHQGLEKAPVNPATVEKALAKLRGLKPELDRWIQEQMPSSESGASQRAPLWGEVKKLNEKLWELQGKDPVISSMARDSRQLLATALEDTAKSAGLGKEYTRARALTRKMENIKFHTAYRAVRVAPAVWEIGGAGVGAALGSGAGPGGMLGGAFAGQHIGRALGKRFASEPTFKVPKESIEAERALWKELGEAPPKGLEQRRTSVRPRPVDPPMSQVLKSAKQAQTVGTKAGAKTDTAFFAQARKELGPKATISDIARRAQELKGPTK